MGYFIPELLFFFFLQSVSGGLEQDLQSQGASDYSIASGPSINNFQG